MRRGLLRDSGNEPAAWLGTWLSPLPHLCSVQCVHVKCRLISEMGDGDEKERRGVNERRGKLERKSREKRKRQD